VLRGNVRILNLRVPHPSGFQEGWVFRIELLGGRVAHAFAPELFFTIDIEAPTDGSTPLVTD
jgi:hypothetical protein